LAAERDRSSERVLEYCTTTSEPHNDPHLDSSNDVEASLSERIRLSLLPHLLGTSTTKETTPEHQIKALYYVKTTTQLYISSASVER